MRAVDRALYVVFAAIATLTVARMFYGYMLLQTQGEWSAPLDDVFIHFDYARATARGYPFQWSPGNGYSSGNTSLLYPFVLSLGHLIGFRGQALMVWAGLVACISIWVFLLASARLFVDLPPWAKYLAPPALFAVGALDWSLFSGMEVAFFLGVWALAFSAALRCMEASTRSSSATTESPAQGWFAQTGSHWLLGAAGCLVVLTRPEGATSIAALGAMCAAMEFRKRGRRHALALLLRAGGPAVLVLAAQSMANRWLTGEFAASGALVKLSLYNPYMTAAEKLDEYLSLLKYVFLRNLEHHFTDAPLYGYIVPAFAAVPLFCRKTRWVAVTLWISILSFLSVVALNGQVRWQNERYTMPAVAWTLLLAAVGLALLLDPRAALAKGASSRVRIAAGARALVSLGLTLLYAIHQAPQMRDQIWFFGRASRNIRDQHIIAGRVLRQMSPRPHRVLVGDAGALIYASDLPGLDLIGLGGYHDLPFARASVHGLGATLELIEHLPPAERPDVFAIYPSWWGELPTWFGRRLTEVPVRGNVICGGAEKVLYRADWRALGRGADPRTRRADEQVIDELDVADLVSEREHDYRFPHPNAGFVDARVLPDEKGRADLFDAGRRIPQERAETFRLKLGGGAGARLIARTASERERSIEVKLEGRPLGALHFARTDGWSEASVPLPAVAGSVEITLTPRDVDWVDHHIWVVQAP